MQSAAATAPRFVRRTALGEGEYRINFKQLDCDVLDALASDEASAVTPAMCKIYIRMTRAPTDCWEREGVLHFTGCDRGGQALTAWEQMRLLTGVSNSTLSKALRWMHEQGIIGYDARKNGVGIRIFFNRAAASIRRREGQKNLRLVPTPPGCSPTPPVGAAFKEEFSEKSLDLQKSPRACARGRTESDPELLADLGAESPEAPPPSRVSSPPRRTDGDPLSLATLTHQIVAELRPVITAAVKRETDATRQWLLSYGLPKATRVAQRETFDLLRSHGVLTKQAKRTGDVGRYDATAEQGSGQEKLVSFLREATKSVRRLSQNVAPEADGLSAACRLADTELSHLLGLATAGGTLNPEEVSNRLESAERAITTALWDAAEVAERESLLHASRNELRRYEGRMEREVFEETVRKRVTGKLRDRLGVPRLNQFYI